MNLNSGSVIVELPFLPVSVNRAFRTGNRKFFRSDSYEIFKRNVVAELYSQGWFTPVPWRSIGVAIWLIPKSRHLFDVDNRAKTLLDAFNKQVWEDDREIVELQIVRCFPEENEKTIVKIYKVEADYSPNPFKRS
ncbi:MAG: RusA family crossover junction endodeoxyribonuclease [Bacilli bacterium]|nr:RusA family crossover junction endodeoxyribonuclease [Bacilli bacterium]